MLAIDSNLLLYALNTACPAHKAAWNFIASLQTRDDVALSEFILVELYVLLRNPVVLPRPMSASEAASVVANYRRHPRWVLLGFDPDSQAVHDTLWKLAARKSFARRRIIDARTALTLVRQGVREFATANTKDFENLGFERVWNPL